MTSDSSGIGRHWAAAFTIVLVVLIIAVSALYLFKRAAELPGKGVDKAVDALKTVADAFRQGTVSTSFISYATSVTGTSYFQFATLRQMEIFERKDERTSFWIPLPDVIVEARAPVEYTYYVDLKGEWKLTMGDRVVRVQAPPIQFNQPAVDASKIEYTVRKGSIFRREDAVVEALKQSITNETMRRAQENTALVREEGRKQVAALMKTWIVRAFADGANFSVDVVFEGEPAEVPIPALDPTRQ